MKKFNLITGAGKYDKIFYNYTRLFLFAFLNYDHNLIISDQKLLLNIVWLSSCLLWDILNMQMGKTVSFLELLKNLFSNKKKNDYSGNYNHSRCLDNNLLSILTTPVKISIIVFSLFVNIYFHI